MRRKTAVAVLLAFFIATSCALVKEDRTACPCFLTLRLRELPSYPVTLSLEGEDYAGQYTLDRDTCLTLPVPKSGIRWQALSGAVPAPDGCVRIPYGYDCPPVYAGGGWVDTACDTVGVEIGLHKHFCTLSLSFEGPEGWGEPYWAGLRGCVEGLDGDGTPLPGEFSCRLDGGGSARLPRQNPEDELWLDIAMPDRVVRSFALGRYLEEAAYDWLAPDLADLPLHIRLSVTRLFFQGDGWTREVPLEIVI